MSLCIRPPAQFRHGGELPAYFDKQDPRSHAFDEPAVDIDLRECDFVRPSAALWCAVYLGLSSARGASARLLVPNNMGVCIYLKSLGLFATVRDLGAEVDDRGVPDREDQNVILPIIRFNTISDATNLANDAFTRLQASGRGAANLTAVVVELFSELVLNAAQHSQSSIGALACVQFFEFENGSRFTCSVADGGIGVYESLRRNPSLRSRVAYDWDALELSVRERVSGTADPHRGIGLYGVSEDVRRPGGSLLLHSGLGVLEINEERESKANRTRLFPGTLASVAIPA